MPYNISATAATPALIIYVIDVSGSMSECLQETPKIDIVKDALREILDHMISCSTKGELVSPRYRLCLLVYNDTVTDILNGHKTITEIDEMGEFELVAAGRTNTAAALSVAYDYLKKIVPKLSKHPAPMVCHLTDGVYTSEDPLPIAKKIMELSTNDGNVLLENIYVGSNLTQQPISDPQKWPGVRSVNELIDPYVQKLFQMSSPLPESYAQEIKKFGYNLETGCRMIFPAVNKDLVRLAFAVSGATPIR